VRPERDDIAIPPFPADLEWVGSVPPSVERLSARGPALIHFVDVADLNSVRTLPYLGAWNDRYAGKGLAVLAVNSPRFPFTARRDAVGAILERLGIRFPVAIDERYLAWRSYGCEGWPSLFLWGRGGVLRWFHFGEGAYVESERAIQGELGEPSAPSPPELPQPLEPLRASDVPGAAVVVPTEEVFPGGAIDVPWRGGQGPVEIEYAAGGAFASLDGRGELQVRVDDGAEGVVEVPGPGLYPLAEHERHEPHFLAVAPSAGVLLHSISFAAGVPEGRPASTPPPPRPDTSGLP